MAALHGISGAGAAHSRRRRETLPENQVFEDYDEVQAEGTARRRPGGIVMITAAQCRSARALIGWSLAKLATAAAVTESELDNFELERQPPSIGVAEAVEAAFAGVGVTFSDDGDIRLRPADAVGAGRAGA